MSAIFPHPRTPDPEAGPLHYFLASRSWALSTTKDHEAFRELLGKTSLLGLMKVTEISKRQSKVPIAIALYQAWLEVNTTSPQAFAAWFNLGTELAAAGDKANAATAYRNALALNPALHQASINLGLTLEAAGDPAAALETWNQALQPTDARTTLLNHRGRLLETQKRYDEAERELFQSLLADPHQPDVIQHWVHLRMKMCAWPVYGEGIPGLSNADLVKNTRGLSTLALFDDVEQIDASVARWLDAKIPKAPEHLSPVEGYRHDRIRLGYLSSDFCMHPISYLTAELFERHDRSRFEVFGYCNSPDDGSAVRNRVREAFDQFKSIKSLSDEDAARVIRQDEIDILIDLNGMTAGMRLGILRWKPAPIQMTYLGFIGSLPLDELDYVICDEYVMPPDQAHRYRPAPLYMPDTYQVNDSKLPVAPAETRAAAGLPDDKFVYCCFSNNYKITEEVFDAWMRILSEVEDSVIWLLADNPWARRNMERRAVERGISADRLYFANRTSPAQYVSRLALADLFLDTTPYNSGTTASDALRVGLPILTLSGQSFASRMAGSLLRCIGLEEGIVTSLEDYVALAVTLGRNHEFYQNYRTRVSGDAWLRTLGDIEAFTGHLERAFQRVVRTPHKIKTPEAVS